MIVPRRWRVYLDSNFFIRFVESGDEALLFLFEQASADLLTLHTSELTLAEVLVDPLRQGDRLREASYMDLLTGDDLMEVVPVGRDILIRSADGRADFGNKLPDAVHVATALACACNVVLSSDRRLRLPSEMTRIGLEDVKDLDLWP